MLEKLKKSIFERKEATKFLSDFDLYASYEELLDQIMDTDVMVLDTFDYDHRDLNKRFVDLSVEAGVKKVYYIQNYPDSDIVDEEQSKLEKYIKEYPGLDASFVSLPMTFETLYHSLINHDKLPKQDFTVMSEADINEVLKSLILIEDNNKEAYDIKGLAYDDVHDYYMVFESQEAHPMRQYKSDLVDFELTTWHEFLQRKKQA